MACVATEGNRPLDAPPCGLQPNSTDVRLLPGLSICLAPTETEAQRRAAASGPSEGPTNHWTVIKTPEQAAEQIAEWAPDIDGFIALPDGSRDSLILLVDEVMPMSRRAGW